MTENLIESGNKYIHELVPTLQIVQGWLENGLRENSGVIPNVSVVTLFIAGTIAWSRAAGIKTRPRHCWHAPRRYFIHMLNMVSRLYYLLVCSNCLTSYLNLQPII